MKKLHLIFAILLTAGSILSLYALLHSVNQAQIIVSFFMMMFCSIGAVLFANCYDNTNTPKINKR